MDPIIKFSKNWNNKLSNLCFTSLMLHDKTKYDYYHKNTGKVFDIFLDGKRHSKAKLVSMETIIFKDIPKIVLAIDTGKFNYFENTDVLKKNKIYNVDSQMIVLLFEKVAI